jgi:predicted metalloprotease with PDZ domain
MHQYPKNILAFSFLFTFLFSFTSLAAEAQNRYRVNIDLTRAKNDQVPVTVMPPEIKEKEIIYNLPKMVPGTYAIYDFGKFIADFQALDKRGKQLEVKRLDENRWQISDARKLDKITYWVNDTWDTPDKKDIVFEPGGTNIEEGKNYLINTHGFVGYFDGQKRVPFELTVTRPQDFYGATPLHTTATTSSTDTYTVPTYNELVDSPLMYSKPDTTVLKVGGADVLVSVYSASGKVDSRTVASELKKVLEAQKNYLGGTLPVQKYAFIIYVADKPNRTGAYGALEHSYSSVYYFPDMSSEMLAEQVRDIAAHEFFHIVTPLSIHAEQIQDFDFQNPQMSEHLWLYEGVTEYFATHVQVNQALITPPEYLERLKEYMSGAEEFNDSLPFTEMSKGALDKYKKEYGNVYAKGALIGLALDIQLRSLTNGKYGLRNLMTDLSKSYGKDRAFKDEELFDKIAQLTKPEIRNFFKKYVEGSSPLPLEDLFEKVGIIYEKEGLERRQTLGRFSLGYDAKTNRLTVADTDNMNAFGKKMGFKKGDQLLQINGEDLNAETAAQLLEKHVKSAPEGSRIIVLVNRPNAKGVFKPVKLRGTLVKTLEKTENRLELDPNATPAQKQLREAWLFSKL